LADGMKMAEAAIDEGRAGAVLERLVRASQAAPEAAVS
jgi:anthranilate phosphoribosyltransferase